VAIVIIYAHLSFECKTSKYFTFSPSPHDISTFPMIYKVCEKKKKKRSAEVSNMQLHTLAYKNSHFEGVLTTPTPFAG